MNTILHHRWNESKDIIFQEEVYRERWNKLTDVMR